MENLVSVNTGFMIRPTKVKTCPRCSSFFITETRCEDCGFVPQEERWGKPYGERSFFALKENYWAKAPIWMKHFPLLETKSSQAADAYKKFLLLRYRHLLDFFAQNATVHPYRSHFYFELKCLVEELLDYPGSTELMLTALPYLDDGRMSPIFEEIGRLIQEKKQKNKNSNALENLTKICGGTQNLNLIVLVIMITAFCAATLQAFPYFVR